MWAAQLGQHKCIQWLIRNGSDTEAADDQGATSLCYAAKHGQLACLKVLLEARACIEGKSFCDTPLVLACKAGHLDCVKLLLEYGALIESDVFSYGFTPLMAAVKGGHQEIASLLVARGADPSIQSDYGFRAIDYAPIEMRDILLSEIERQQLSYILSQRRSESKMVETLGL